MRLRIMILLLLSFVLTTAAEDLCPSSRHRHTDYRDSSADDSHQTMTDQQNHYRHPQQNRFRSQGKALQGSYRQLVYLVAFSDQAFMDEQPMALWDRIFNEPDFTEEPFVGSVHDYFLDQSYGQFDLHFDLHYVVMEDGRSKYSSGKIGNVDDDSRSGLLLTDLLDMTKDDINDWSVYDWNDDGYIDQIFILYAGKGQNDGGGNVAIWPHQWRLSEQSESPFNREWGHPYEVAGGLLVDCYGAFAELTGSNTYGTFGTLCHEYSHCLGLPDIYYNGSSQVVGAWDLMDRGNYNGDGFCPPGYSAHERMLMGWIDVKELSDDTTVTSLGALPETQEAYLIRNEGWADEYYIVENRQQTGWDSSLPSSGLVVFHVDYDEEEWAVGIPNSRDLKRYSIIPANNNTSTYSSKNWPYPYQGNRVLTNDSKPAATLNHPNVDGNKLMSKSITNITLTDGVCAFDFENNIPTAIQEYSVSKATTAIYDLQGRYVGKDENVLLPGIYIRDGKKVLKDKR